MNERSVLTFSEIYLSQSLDERECKKKKKIPPLSLRVDTQLQVSIS